MWPTVEHVLLNRRVLSKGAGKWLSALKSWYTWLWVPECVGLCAVGSVDIVIGTHQHECSLFLHFVHVFTCCMRGTEKCFCNSSSFWVILKGNHWYSTGKPCSGQFRQLLKSSVVAMLLVWSHDYFWLLPRKPVCQISKTDFCYEVTVAVQGHWLLVP